MDIVVHSYIDIVVHSYIDIVVHSYIDIVVHSYIDVVVHLSQNAKRASARKDTGLDQSLFLQIQLFHFLDYKSGQYKGRYGVLDMVFKIRDHHHRIHRQILRQNDGLILILAQS